MWIPDNSVVIVLTKNQREGEPAANEDTVKVSMGNNEDIPSLRFALDIFFVKIPDLSAELSIEWINVVTSVALTFAMTLSTRASISVTDSPPGHLWIAF
jgi:hypothetical protein